jgi:hypothetical protein
VRDGCHRRPVEQVPSPGDVAVLKCVDGPQEQVAHQTVLVAKRLAKLLKELGLGTS